MFLFVGFSNFKSTSLNTNFRHQLHEFLKRIGMPEANFLQNPSVLTGEIRQLSSMHRNFR